MAWRRWGWPSLIAQDISLAVVIVLANGHGGGGALVLYNYGWQMFFVPYAVLAVPIATSAFPVLSARDGVAFDQTAASSTRAVMLVSWLGAALLAGAAIPASRLFAPSGPVQARELAIAFAAFAPGLVGYGLAANLSRVLFAHQRSRVAAIALVAGWLLVIVTDLAAVPAVPHRWVVPVLAMGNTVGLTVAGIALLAAVRAARGRLPWPGRGGRRWPGWQGHWPERRLAPGCRPGCRWPGSSRTQASRCWPALRRLLRSAPSCWWGTAGTCGCWPRGRGRGSRGERPAAGAGRDAGRLRGGDRGRRYR